MKLKIKIEISKLLLVLVLISALKLETSFQQFIKSLLKTKFKTKTIKSKNLL